MKFKRVLIAISAFGLLTLAACKKDNKEETPKTTAQKLQAKWGVENLMTHLHENGEDSTDTYTGTADDYFDFRPDGTLYARTEGTTDTLSYALQSDTKLIITVSGFAATFDIQNLTDNALKLYSKQQLNASVPEDIYETTINLKK